MILNWIKLICAKFIVLGTYTTKPACDVCLDANISLFFPIALLVERSDNAFSPVLYKYALLTAQAVTTAAAGQPNFSVICFACAIEHCDCNP